MILHFHYEDEYLSESDWTNSRYMVNNLVVVEQQQLKQKLINKLSCNFYKYLHFTTMIVLL
jgi:hypothetical protein